MSLAILAAAVAFAVGALVAACYSGGNMLTGEPYHWWSFPMFLGCGVCCGLSVIAYFVVVARSA